MGYHGGISAVVLYNRRMPSYKYKRRAPAAPTSSSGPRSYIKGEKLVHRTKTHRPGRRRRCARACRSPAAPSRRCIRRTAPVPSISFPYPDRVSTAAAVPSAGRIAGPAVMTGLVVWPSHGSAGEVSKCW